MSKIKAVIFDMDGVLIDTEKHLVPSWQEAAIEAGFPFEWEHGLFMRSLDHREAEKEMKKIFGDSFDYKSIRKRRQEIVAQRIEKYGLDKKPGVDEILGSLKEQGISRVVATSSSFEIASERLEMIGVRHKFDKIVSALMVEHGKPAPDVYLYACSCIDADPENCIAIEDSPNGVRSASSAGLKVIMVPDLSQPDAELQKMYFKKAESLFEARDIISGMLKENERM